MEKLIPVEMNINYQHYQLNVSPTKRLLDVLREDLGLIGTKECCGIGECGACTVLVNGRAINSCLMLAVEADGTDILTVEGLSHNGRLDSLQEAFLEKGAVQCGFCIPGQLIAAKYLLTQNPHPTRQDVEEGMAGNLCRCGGYERIIDAIMSVAENGEAQE
ncbi:xanthine dehydrogenase, Fe-S binding subunit [uncultured spirochete]|uniref:Xanthine dehydrogenase, Fe-S binding subunit n=1 Tax=uncultured spirochete TaxID=156406 RepID=A0A3P3XPB0_9SPIR|nr:xanthine dehydrogenase, Fe-S binding subunit [uncultured spirochete]